jgi:hypothetical protein
MPRRMWTVALGALLSLLAADAKATPQVSAGLTTGAALTDLRAENAPRLAYHLGGRLDVLLLRDRANRMALGPYVDVATAAFDTFETGGGLEWLLPAGDTAFIFSAGAFARTSRFGWEPGAAGTIFWGSRSFNYHSTYSLGAGLFLQGRYGLAGDGRQADAIFGVQIDLEYLALPFLFAYEAIAH